MSNKSYMITVQEFLNIPSTELIANIENIPAGKSLAVYCATNKRSKYAVMALTIFDDRDAGLLLDGVRSWKSAGQPVEYDPE